MEEKVDGERSVVDVKVTTVHYRSFARIRKSAIVEFCDLALGQRFNNDYSSLASCCPSRISSFVSCLSLLLASDRLLADRGKLNSTNTPK